MAIEVAKHAFSRARTHAMRDILSARRLVQRIEKYRRNTVQATLTQIMGIQHTPAEGTGTSQEQEARRHIQQGGRATTRRRTNDTEAAWVIVRQGEQQVHRRIWRWDTKSGVSVAVLVTAQVYEQYKRNS